MSWTTADVDRHKKGLTDKQKKTWVKVANSALKRCKGEGGSQEECEGSAIRQANKVAGNMNEYKGYTTSTNSVLISVNAIDVDGEPVPVAELVAAYEEQRGEGQGQGGERQGDGGVEVCVCPKCGREFDHKKGTPCNEMKCLECGTTLTGKSSTEEMGEQDGDKEDWRLTKSDIRELIGLIDAELKRRKAKKEGETKEMGEMEPISDDMPLEKLIAALFKSCPSRAGKSKSEWKSSVRSWVKSAPTKSLTGYRRRLTMVGAKMGESEQMDIDGIKGLLQEALAMLDAPMELAEADLCENITADALIPEGDHSAAILEVVKEAGITAGEGRRAPVVVDLQIIRPGPGNKKDNRYYPSATLKNYAHVFEGADVFVTDHKAKERSEKTKVGRIRECPIRFTEVDGPVGRTIVYDPDMAEKIRNRADAGELDTLHCSIYGKGDIRPGKVDGVKYDIVETIKSGPLVEFVSKAGAGGHAVGLAENEGGVMLDKETVEGLLTESDLSQEVQERLAGAEYESEEAVKEAILQEQAQEEPQQLAEAEVTKMLSETNLPSVSRKRLAGGEYEDESALREAILAETEYVKTLTGSGQPFGQGASRAQQETKPLEERLDAIDQRYGLRALKEEVQNA